MIGALFPLQMALTKPTSLRPVADLHSKSLDVYSFIRFYAVFGKF